MASFARGENLVSGRKFAIFAWIGIQGGSVANTCGARGVVRGRRSMRSERSPPILIGSCSRCSRNDTNNSTVSSRVSLPRITSPVPIIRDSTRRLVTTRTNPCTDDLSKVIERSSTFRVEPLECRRMPRVGSFRIFSSSVL